MRHVHRLWPEPEGVSTWEHLPNHSELLFQLKMWTLHGSDGGLLYQVMDKVTPYRSKARSLGDILTQVFQDRPKPRLPTGDSPKQKKKRKELMSQWHKDLRETMEFRRLFGQLTWITTQVKDFGVVCFISLFVSE